MREEELLQAAKDGRLDEIRRALAADPALGRTRLASGETPLMAALYRGHREVVATLVDAGAPLDLFAAAALGRLDILDAELASNPSAVNAYAFDGWTPLHLAAFFGQTAAMARLLEAGADTAAVSRNSLTNTPLHAAVAGGHVDGALLLIERGAPVNVTDAGGHTPLHIAAEAGTVPIVTALLDRGADPHAVDAEDKTPLSRAAARNHNDVIDIINLR
ncbi:MAG TPA: ankyrin repeat domain-containing protein [Vicinamibacterales bacterium]